MQQSDHEFSPVKHMILPKLVQSELANLPFQLKASGQYMILFANKSNDISRYQRMDKTVELSFFWQLMYGLNILSFKKLKKGIKFINL